MTRLFLVLELDWEGEEVNLKIKAPSVCLLALTLIATGMISCGAETSSPADPLFRQGDKYLAEQSYKAAIETFQSIRDQYPSTFDASYAEERIAVCYYSWANDLKYENEYETAIEKLQILVEQYPDTDAGHSAVELGEIPFAYLQWGDYLMLEKQDYQSALGKYEFIIAEYPETKYNYAAKAWENISWCYLRWGHSLYDEENYAEAIEKYEIVLTEYPDSECASELLEREDLSRCYYELAERQQEEGDLDAAMETYEAILQRWPQSLRASSAKDKLPHLYLAKASQLEQEKRWGEAFQIYEKILSQFPDSREASDVRITLLPPCSYEYARLLQSEGKYEEAIEKYETSSLREAEEALPECYYLWAQQLQEEHQYDEALEKYVIILNDYLDTDWASWEKGEILSAIPAEYLYNQAAKLGVSESALRLYQAILDYHPQSDYITGTKKAMVDIGIALIMEGEHGIIPPATSEGTVAAGGTALIEVRNGTPYTLLLLFKGPDTEVVYLKPDPDAKEYGILPFGGITEYTEETIKLRPGAYQIGARVSKTAIAPWYGTDTFQSNEQYSEIFYIRVTYG